MKIKEIIQEARKNPEQNPKVPVNKEIIDVYKNAPMLSSIDDTNCFVSFTELDKLGINPTSSYRTPIGIYAYPASYIIDEIGPEESMKELPFAGDQPYANIFSVSGNIVDITNMTSKEAHGYYLKIGKYYADRTKDRQSWKSAVDEVELFINSAEKYAKFPDSVGGRFWYVTLKVAESLSTPRTIQIQNPKTKNISTKDTDSAPIEWNKLFRTIGIDGFVDYGSGIIHTSEPTQAVFFSKNIIKNNKRVYNKYSFDDQQLAIIHGRKMKKLKQKSKEYELYADTHTPEEFLKKYYPDDLQYIKNPKNMIKFLQHHPILYDSFTKDYITYDVAKLAVSLDGMNWSRTPFKLRTLELFKLAMNSNISHAQKSHLINYANVGKDEQESSKIMDYIHANLQQYY